MTTGTLGGPARALGLAGPFRGVMPVRLPLAVLAIEEASGDVTLVDVGWSAAQCAAPMRALGPLTAAFLGVSTRAGDSVVEQLAARGIDRRRVVRILATHLHDDHIAGVADFPSAEIVTSRAELDSAHARRKLDGFVAVHGGALARSRCVAPDSSALVEVVDSARIDPDFRLARVDLRGHTAGSVGVVVRVGQRVIVHLGDAAYTI
ncbi:MAG: MBL fold metallo-hydrolase, partial [Polyangiales bacterium]